jgi:hypothetical protein
MLGELKVYTQSGNYVLTVNGGHCTVRRESQKPYEATKVENGSSQWQAIYEQLYKLEWLIESAVNLK